MSKRNYKKGKLCVGLGEQEEYLSAFEFKGEKKLKGIWIIQDYKNDFYRFFKAVRKSLNARNGTYLFKKITFKSSGKRVLSEETYRLGVKRSKTFSINHTKEISFYPRDISNSECSNWYDCGNNHDCLNCGEYFNLKTFKKINLRFKIKELLLMNKSKKRFKAIVYVDKPHYLVRGYSMTKISTNKKKKDYFDVKTYEPEIFFEGYFIPYKKYLKIQKERSCQ